MVSSHNMLLSELLADVDVAKGFQDVEIGGIQLDSRRVESGDLFVALSGAKTNASDYVRDAIKNGASAIVSEGERSYQVHSESGVGELSIPGLKGMLGNLASKFFGHPSAGMSVIGVTGTNGKTSVANYLATLLDSNGIKSGVIGTLGFGLVGGSVTPTNYTTPDVVEVHRCLAALRGLGAQSVVMEVSSHGLEQGRVDGVQFEGAVFTNLSRDHLDYHGSMEAYLNAKTKLFEREGLVFAVVNGDDPASSAFQSVLKKDVRLLSFGIASEAQVRAEDITYRTGIQARVTTPSGCFDLDSRLLGQFNLHNLLAVVSVGVAKGLSMEGISDSVNQLKAVPGRMEMIRVSEKPIAVVDYAHTPDALENALEALAAHRTGMLFVIFGCGGDRDTGKRPLMASIAEEKADRIVVTDDNPRTESPEEIVNDILKGFSKEASVKVIHEREKAIRETLLSASSNDIVLIAGKGHEDYQDIGGVKLPFSDVLVAEKVLGMGGRACG